MLGSRVRKLGQGLEVYGLGLRLGIGLGFVIEHGHQIGPREYLTGMGQ